VPPNIDCLRIWKRPCAYATAVDGGREDYVGYVTVAYRGARARVATDFGAAFSHGTPGRPAAIVRVLADNSACVFYERLGAVPLRDDELLIAGKAYPERWYGWHNLGDLAV